MIKRNTQSKQIVSLSSTTLAAVCGGGSYTQKETLASSLQKKQSDTDGQVIGKI